MALARDNHGLANYGGSGNSVTLSSYINGGNVMIVFVYSTANDVTSVKWNTSESFTQIGSAQQVSSNTKWISAWKLVNPTVTTANIVATRTASSVIGLCVASYTGASSTQPDSFNSLSETASGDRAAPVTVVASGCWIVTMEESNNADPTAAFNGLILSNAPSQVNGFVDSNGTVGTGSQSVGWHWASNDTHGIFAVAIAPAPTNAVKQQSYSQWSWPI